MLIVFNSGPECLADDRYTIKRIVEQLEDGVTLCFVIPFDSQKQNDRMTALIKTRNHLDEIFRQYGFPTYSALVQPTDLKPINGHLGVWVQLKQSDRTWTKVVHAPIMTNRSRAK